MLKRKITIQVFLISVLVAGMFLGQAKAQKGPQLSLQPSLGPAEVKVVVRGSGFLKSCGVNLSFEEEKSSLAFAPVKKDGSFVALATIPKNATIGQRTLHAQGLLSVKKICKEPSLESTKATFVVVKQFPSLSIDTFESTPGGTINISGSGFCSDPACSAIKISIDGQIVADSVPVRPDGTLSTQAQVPGINMATSVSVEAVQVGVHGEERRAFGELVVAVKPNVRPTGPK